MFPTATAHFPTVGLRLITPEVQSFSEMTILYFKKSVSQESPSNSSHFVLVTWLAAVSINKTNSFSQTKACKFTVQVE